jgi:hypothetical protein
MYLLEAMQPYRAGFVMLNQAYVGRSSSPMEQEKHCSPRMKGMAFIFMKFKHQFSDTIQL